MLWVKSFASTNLSRCLLCHPRPAVSPPLPCCCGFCPPSSSQRAATASKTVTPPPPPPQRRRLTLKLSEFRLDVVWKDQQWESFACLFVCLQKLIGKKYFDFAGIIRFCTFSSVTWRHSISCINIHWFINPNYLITFNYVYHWYGLLTPSLTITTVYMYCVYVFDIDLVVFYSHISFISKDLPYLK